MHQLFLCFVFISTTFASFLIQLLLKLNIPAFFLFVCFQIDDDYYEDDEEDDPDALKDPIYQIDLQVQSLNLSHILSQI